MSLLIKDLFAKPIERRIEEVIKVDQADEETVYQELEEYVLTESIGDHFLTVYRAIAEAKREPHEGIGIWVSGFFGSGKSSFAKILGYTVANRVVLGRSASEILKEKARFLLSSSLAEQLSSYLDFINQDIPTHVVIFDVSQELGTQTEKLTQIMYKALLKELDYAPDFDLAELEMALEADGELDRFIEEFEKIYGKPWATRRKMATRALSEASALLHRLYPSVYSSKDSWANTVAKSRADISPNLLAERAFELMRRRKPGQALMFVIDEVGQYVSQSIDRMLDLQAIVQAFGRESKNRVKRGEAPAPCWIVVTSQEKLNEVVDALGSRKIELARLQDRFPIHIDLKQSDISEITSKRILQKNEKGAKILAELYEAHEGRLKNICQLERSGRNTEIAKKTFIDLYPYLPYQIDLCIDIVSGLRLRRGVHRHIGGSNRTMIKQAQQMLISPQTNLAQKPVGELVTLDKVFELLYAGDLIPSEVTRELDDVPKRLPGDDIAYKVAKAIALLEVVVDLPRTARNLAVVLHPNVEADSILSEVEAALKRLMEKQIIKEAEDGYKLLTLQEKQWDEKRRELYPKPAEKKRILKDMLKDIFSDPAITDYRYQKRRRFSFAVRLNGEDLSRSGDIPLNVWLAEDEEDLEEMYEEARKQSSERSNELFWIFDLTDEIDKLAIEFFRSEKMIQDHQHLAAQGKLTPEEVTCFNEEKVRLDRFKRTLRTKLMEALASGTAFFRGVRKDASALGESLSEIFARLRDEIIPELYPKFELGAVNLKGKEVEEVLKTENLEHLSTTFYEPPLNLLVREGGRTLPNLEAEVCKEILDYIKRQHSYGEKVTGKTLENYFGGLGYAWPIELLQLVLALLLRAGAIEVTYQGRKFSEPDPLIYKVFTGTQAFRQASFAPRKALPLHLLAQAARNYEEITGDEVEIMEEGAIARAFKLVAEKDRDLLRELIPKMKAQGLSGVEMFEDFQRKAEAILTMPTDACVETLAKEGESYKEARAKAKKLSDILTPQNLELLNRAKRALKEKCPELKRAKGETDFISTCEDLSLALSAENFYENLERINHLTQLISNAYEEIYREIHEKRTRVFATALEEIKALDEWAKLSSDPSKEGRVKELLRPLEEKLCEALDLSGDVSVCRHCRATIAQMESDIAAKDTLKSTVIAELQSLSAPEKRVVRLKASSLLGNVIETPEDLEQAVSRLKEELEKLLKEGVRVVLE